MLSPIFTNTDGEMRQPDLDFSANKAGIAHDHADK